MDKLEKLAYELETLWVHTSPTRKNAVNLPRFFVFGWDKKERQNTKNTVVFLVLAMRNREDPRHEERGEFGRVSRVKKATKFGRVSQSKVLLKYHRLEWVPINSACSRLSLHPSVHTSHCLEGERHNRIRRNTTVFTRYPSDLALEMDKLEKLAYELETIASSHVTSCVNPIRRSPNWATGRCRRTKNYHASTEFSSLLCLAEWSKIKMRKTYSFLHIPAHLYLV